MSHQYLAIRLIFFSLRGHIANDLFQSSLEGTCVDGSKSDKAALSRALQRLGKLLEEQILRSQVGAGDDEGRGDLVAASFMLTCRKCVGQLFNSHLSGAAFIKSLTSSKVARLDSRNTRFT